jgi:hypothetical protein
MSKHYSRILQAARYQTALTAYTEYITGKAERQPNIGTKGNRPPSTKLYISPFSFTIGATDKLETSANQAAWTEHEGAFGSHTLAALPSGDVSFKIRGFRPSKVVIITGRSGSGTVKTSHITKTKYLSYGGSSRSIPFGKAASGDTEVTVFDTIRDLVAPTGSPLKVYLSPEKA